MTGKRRNIGYDLNKSLIRLLCCVLLLSSSFLAHAQRINIQGTDASFESPAGFKELSAEILALKFNRGGNPPKFAVGNEDATTSVAYELRQVKIIDAELPGILSSFEKQFQGRIPGLQWIRRELIEKEGQRWIYLEFTSTAVDADIYNLLLMTPLKDGLLAINFNSTRSDFIQYETILRASIESIRLRPVTNTK